MGSISRQNNKGSPFVSIVIPVRNEENQINDCLRSLINQDYPKDRYEIIVVDDSSTDGSRNIIEQIMNTVNKPKITLLNNKGKGVVDAYKTGIESSSGEILVRFTAHIVCDFDTIRSLIFELIKEEKDVKGVTTGYKIYGSDSFFSKAIVHLLTSRMGGWGTSHQKRGNIKTNVGSAVLAINKRTLDLIGGYPDGDDSELYVLFNKKGWFVKYLADQKVAYRYHHKGLINHLKRMFVYGKIRSRLSKKYFESLKLIHLAPSILLLSSILLLISLMIPTNSILPLFLEIMLGSYLLLTIFQSVRISLDQKSFYYLLLLPPLFYLTHLSYGLGFFSGLIGKNYSPSLYK